VSIIWHVNLVTSPSASQSNHSSSTTFQDDANNQNEAEMSDNKGKGKARAPFDENENASQEKGSPSILSRVAASASGLTRSVFSAPSNNELSNQAAAILTHTGKGQASSFRGAASSDWEGSSKSSEHIQRQANGPAGVKAGHSEEHMKQSEDDFSSFLEGIDSFSSSGPSGSIGVDAYKDIGSTWGEAWARAQTVEDVEDVAHLPRSKAVVEQGNLDGQEVLELLSRLGAIDGDFEPPENETEEIYNWGFTPEQISLIQAMTRHLPPPELHAGMSIDDPLNLLPNMNFEGRALWIEQWECVLTRYTDEVWGGLLPLVREARQEVEEIKAAGFIAEKPIALRRLEGILGHFRRP